MLQSADEDTFDGTSGTATATASLTPQMTALQPHGHFGWLTRLLLLRYPTRIYTAATMTSLPTISISARSAPATLTQDRVVTAPSAVIPSIFSPHQPCHDGGGTCSRTAIILPSLGDENDSECQHAGPGDECSQLTVCCGTFVPLVWAPAGCTNPPRVGTIGRFDRGSWTTSSKPMLKPRTS